MWRARDEFEQSGGSETMESSRWALPRQVIEIPSLLVKNSQDRIYGEQTQSIFIWYSLGTPLVFSPVCDEARRISNFQVVIN